MEQKKRLYGRQYELSQICVPQEEAEFILSKRRELRECKANEVYLQLKQEYRLSPDYATSRKLQYLYELFWVLGSRTPILVRKSGERECVPTDYLRNVSTWGFNKVQPCWVLSLRVRLQAEQLASVREMMSIAEKKMRSFQTDFYFHDMIVVSRELGGHPMLWVVGQSHTFLEVHDSGYDAECWAKLADTNRRNNMLRGYEDDTWMGAALDVAIGQDDLLYYIDKGGTLHKVSREKFTELHSHYIGDVRAKACVLLEP